MLTSSLIKKIKSLKDKKERIAQKLFIAEGEKSVKELLHSSYSIETIYALEGWINLLDEQLAKKFPAKVEKVSEKDLARISQLTQPNKVLAVVQLPEKKITEEDLKSAPILAFENISDPGNLGSIIRIADWFGIKTIVCSKNSVDAYNYKVVQATMGSIFRINIFYENLEEFILKAKLAAGLKVYGATLKGESIYSTKKNRNGVVVFGNESKGISDELLKLVDQQITIPSFQQSSNNFSSAESLNIAMATAIICNEWRRQ